MAIIAYVAQVYYSFEIIVIPYGKVTRALHLPSFLGCLLKTS